MKRLFTILISSIAIIGLQAQTVPMAIYGDVYNAGKMLSLGEVHIKADPGKVGRVDNHGEFKVGVYVPGSPAYVTSRIIFYTNRERDGLLKNTYVYPHDMDILTPNVYVRKNIDKNFTWFTMSLPFDVEISQGIINPLTGLPLTGRSTLINDESAWGDFEVQFYDANNRAQTGQSGEDNWKKNKTGWIDRGTAFRFYVKFNSLANPANNASYDIDFKPSGGWNQAYDLFKYEDKGDNLLYYPVNPNLITGPIVYPEVTRVGQYNSDGWNAIGGLNSDDFLMNKIEFPGTFSNPSINLFYIQGNNTSWRPYKFNDPTYVGLLRPYAAIFVKTAAASTFIKGSSPGLTFQETGNTLETGGSSSIIFRSLDGYYADYDLFRIDLKEIGDDIDKVPVYFQFNDEYSSFYKNTEDNIVFSTDKSNTTISAWSLAEIENLNMRNRLFSNSLPYKEHEIPLGINIPKSGDYIFNLKHVVNHENPIKEISSVVLWDKDTDVKIELLQSDYYFKANSDFNSEDRFVLFFNSRVTGLDKMPDLSEPYAYTENNILTVKNLMQGDKVQVYDLTGRAIVFGVAQDNTFTAPLNQKGIYVVNVKGGKTFKVLNK